MLSVEKPSALRLWGFLLTVVGGAMVAFGSVATWAAISLSDRVEGAVPTKGLDTWQGIATLVLGAIIVGGIVVLRAVSPSRRRLVVWLILAAGIAALGLALWCALAPDQVFRDSGIDHLVQQVVQGLGVPAETARKQIETALDRLGIGVKPQMGLWVTLAGAAVAVLGGILDLMWVRERAAVERDSSSTPPTPSSTLA